jgi:hypothetical protein
MRLAATRPGAVATESGARPKNNETFPAAAGYSELYHPVPFEPSSSFRFGEINVSNRRRFPRFVILAAVSTCLLASSLAPPAVVQSANAQATLNEAQPVGPAATAGETETVAVLAVNSYTNLINDIGFLGGLADRPEIGQMLEGFVALFTQGRGLVGLDKAKPWGVLLRTDGVEFMPVGCLPVNNVRELTNLVAAFGVVVEELGDEVLEIKIPEQPSIFVKSADGWAFLTSDVDYLDNLPANPGAEIISVLGEYDVAARASVQKIPESYRTMAVEQLRAGLEEGLEREEDEDDETFEMRRKWSEGQLNNVVRMIQEIVDLNLGWSLDAQQQRIYLDAWYHVTPGGKLDQTLTSIAANSKTNYAGFFQPDAAICTTFVKKADPELIREEIDNFKMTMLSIREQVAKSIDEEEDDLPADPAAREVIKSAANDVLDAIEATITTGQMEGGAVVNLYPNAMTFIAGGHVSEPQKVEAGLKKLVALAQQEPDFPGIHWNADQHKGITFHTAQAPVEEDDEDARQLFGPMLDITLGIGQNSVYVGLGRENIAALKGAIDASASQPGKAVPMMETLVSMRQILEFSLAFMEEDKEQEKMITQAIVDMLRNDAQGRDHIRIVGQPIKHGQRYRIEAEEGVLRALGKASIIAQDAAATGAF